MINQDITKTDLKTFINHSLAIFNDLSANDYQTTLTTVYQLLDTAKLRVDFEDDLVDSGIVLASDAIGKLEQKIDKLQKINPNNSSKNKTKKAKKAIKRYNATIKTIKSAHKAWFLNPITKNPKPINQLATRNFLEEFQEMLGATLLPSEQIAKKQQIAMHTYNA